MAITIDVEFKKKKYTTTEAKKRGFSKRLIERYWNSKHKKRKKEVSRG